MGLLEFGQPRLTVSNFRMEQASIRDLRMEQARGLAQVPLVLSRKIGLVAVGKSIRDG